MILNGSKYGPQLQVERIYILPKDRNGWYIFVFFGEENYEPIIFPFSVKDVSGSVNGTLESFSLVGLSTLVVVAEKIVIGGGGGTLVTLALYLLPATKATKQLYL